MENPLEFSEVSVFNNENAPFKVFSWTKWHYSAVVLVVVEVQICQIGLEVSPLPGMKVTSTKGMSLKLWVVCSYSILLHISTFDLQLTLKLPLTFNLSGMMI